MARSRIGDNHLVSARSARRTQSRRSRHLRSHRRRSLGLRPSAFRTLGPRFEGVAQDRRRVAGQQLEGSGEAGAGVAMALADPAAAVVANSLPQG